MPEPSKPKKKVAIIEAEPPAPGPVKIRRLSVTNLRGVEGTITVEAGSVRLLIISGSARSGKSTVLDAAERVMVKHGLRPAHDVIHDGQAEAVIVEDLSNGIKVERRYARDDVGEPSLMDLKVWEAVPSTEASTGFKLLPVAERKQTTLDKWLKGFSFYPLEGAEELTGAEGRHKFRDECLGLVTMPDIQERLLYFENTSPDPETKDGQALIAERLMFDTIGADDLTRYMDMIRAGDNKALFEAIDKDIAATEEVRAESRRNADSTRHAAENIIIPAQYAKAEPVDTKELTAEMMARSKKLQENQKVREALATAQRMSAHAKQALAKHEAEIAEARAKLNMLVEQTGRYELSVTQSEVMVSDMDAQANALVDPDLDEVRTKINDAEAINDAVRKRKLKTEKEQEAAEHEANWTAYDAKCKAYPKLKYWFIQRGKWPVPGTGFDEDGLTWNGRKWSDLSGSEKLVVLYIVRCARNRMKPDDERMSVSLLDEFPGDEQTLQAMIDAVPDQQIWAVLIDRSTGQALRITNGVGPDGKVTLKGGEVLATGATPRPISEDMK